MMQFFRNFFSVIVLILVVVFLVGCDGSISDTAVDIGASVNTYLNIKTEKGIANLEISAFPPSNRNEQDLSIFDNTVAIVNDIALQKSDDHLPDFATRKFFYEGNNLKLETGDKAEILLRHSMLGKLEEDIKVPPKPTNIFIVNEGDTINKYVNEEIDSLKIGWFSVDCDEYYVVMEKLYNENNDYLVGSSRWIENNYYTFGNEDLYGEDDNKPAAIKIKVYAVNSQNYSTSYGSLQFRVQSPSAESISSAE